MYILGLFYISVKVFRLTNTGKIIICLTMFYKFLNIERTFKLNSVRAYQTRICMSILTLFIVSMTIPDFLEREKLIILYII